jgi:phenylpropionate dioxygenase-like ring-hydroxylating dioxygenase large terminal subunit
MAYLTNTWYAVAWGDEIDHKLFSRKVIDQPLVLFRHTNGEVVALQDRCPHRFSPLHLGKRNGDCIQCPYHGLTFDAAGQCVANPHGDGTIPVNAVVKKYTTAERHKLVWVWMGDPDKVDQTLIPDFGFVHRDDLVTIKGTIHGEGNYELYADNILDLSHAEFLHPGLGSRGLTEGKREFSKDGNTVWSNVSQMNDYLSILLADLFQVKDKQVDFWCDVRWDPPSSMGLYTYIGDHGLPREKAHELPSFHIFTPETETTTHYFWAFSRAFRKDEEMLTRQLQAGLAYIFESEDKPMIAAQQKNMGTADFWSLRPVFLPGDGGGVRARKVLMELIETERRAEHYSPASEPHR